MEQWQQRAMIHVVAEAMEAHAAEARREALEEAHRKCVAVASRSVGAPEGSKEHGAYAGAMRCQAAVYALIEPPSSGNFESAAAPQEEGSDDGE